MRVVCNSRTLSGRRTGVQRYLAELLDHIGHEMTLVHPSSRLSGSVGHVWEQMVLPLRIGDSLLWSPANTGPLAVRRQVLTLHDTAPLDHPEWFSPKFASWYRFVIPRLARRVFHIITVSNEAKDRILAHTGVFEEKISVVPNGVSTRFGSDAAPRIDGLPNSYLLSVGSLEPRKNIRRLLEAWELIQRNGHCDGPTLVIAGASDRRIFSSQGFAKLPANVLLLGHVSDAQLPSLYKYAIAFVYPSMYEGFGLPVLEAMASGTPVICSDSGALREVGGSAVLAVDCHSTTAIAEAIRSVIRREDLRTELVTRGFKRASMYRWDSAAAETLRILRSAAEQSL